MPRIPRDQEEFRAFIKDFAEALIVEGKDDAVLVDGGKKLTELLSGFVKKAQEAQDHEAKRLKAVGEKDEFISEITEVATTMIAYLEYKCGKSSRDLAVFKIPPRKKMGRAPKKPA
ncbi:MAG: hypothetical protein PHQ23_01230 [Candidatus Wallbacteria bacterium]|nr:hypothetical protein [Candidatus Wallbacteria bacterium]